MIDRSSVPFRGTVGFTGKMALCPWFTLIPSNIVSIAGFDAPLVWFAVL
jgi:hypothetical protein